MTATSVAIIGLGSRGLSVLERIVTLAKLAGPAAGEVVVEAIDPSCTGAGVHTTDQPDYLLLNTTCSQVSMFPDGHSVGSAVDEPGPNLYEWVTARRLRLGEDGFTVGHEGREIRPCEFLPRRVLGEYLGWFLGQVLARAPGHVRVNLHRAAAVDLHRLDDQTLAIDLSDGGGVRVQYAFLTTGYTPNATAAPAAGGARFLADPYDLSRLAEIGPGQTVAISGFGLSAMDVMSCLTVGRGGQFTQDSGEARYRPSGDEPTLVFFSRSGVPCRSRPLVTVFEQKYQPLVLTHAGIDALRQRREAPLDFDADVLPLILTEMRIAYRRCEARCAGGDAEPELLRRLTAAGDQAGLGQAGLGQAGLGQAELDAARVGEVLDELDQRLGPFDPRTTLEATAGMLLDDAAAYQKWLTEVVRRDLAEGEAGFARSPVKAALDILRDLRDTIRYVVDFGGLTGQSLDRFHRRMVPIMNRAVVGPQFERHSELLALMEIGLAAAPLGPSPSVRFDERASRWAVTSSQLAVAHTVQADWLVSARIDLPAVDRSASPLLNALHRKGWIRRHRPSGSDVAGLDVNADLHPLDADGDPDRRVWVLGPLCEGATFYTNLVPSPHVYSRPIVDAHRCVTAMFAAMSARGS